MATCPECDAELEIADDDLEEMEAGDPWDCDSCGSRLRVASLDPLEFESEDDDDEDEEEESGEEKAEGAGEDDLDDDFDDDDDDADDDGDGGWDE